MEIMVNMAKAPAIWTQTATIQIPTLDFIQIQFQYLNSYENCQAQCL